MQKTPETVGFLNVCENVLLSLAPSFSRMSHILSDLQQAWGSSPIILHGRQKLINPVELDGALTILTLHTVIPMVIWPSVSQTSL